MRWPCVPSKKSEPSPVVPSQVEPVVSVDPVVSSEPVVSEAPVKKCCSQLACAPVACAPLSCLPLCCKASQPLVLRSTPPAETDKLTDVAKVSVPDVAPVQVSPTEPVAPVVHESQI